MISVKDRIPTKPYRRKITHEESALPSYELDENGHLIVTIPDVEYATVERADEPTEDGTPINKLLFDSIDTDIQARVVLADKATTAEAKAGVSDTKWLTPLKMQQKLTTLTTNRTITSSTTTTLVNGSTAGEQIITIDAKMSGGMGTSYYSKFQIEGTGIIIFEDGSIDGSGTSVELAKFTNNSTRNSAFHLEIDTCTKTLSGWAVYGASLADKKFQGYYTTLSSLNHVQNYAGITSNISVRYSNSNPNA